MVVPFNEAENNLKALASWYDCTEKDARNEATTRLQLINRLLFECLGWDVENCKAEERLDGKYTDYSLY